MDIFLKFKEMPNALICNECGFAVTIKPYKRFDNYIYMFCNTNKCKNYNDLYEYLIPRIEAKLISKDS